LYTSREPNALYRNSGIRSLTSNISNRPMSQQPQWDTGVTVHPAVGHESIQFSPLGIDHLDLAFLLFALTFLLFALTFLLLALTFLLFALTFLLFALTFLLLALTFLLFALILLLFAQPFHPLLSTLFSPCSSFHQPTSQPVKPTACVCCDHAPLVLIFIGVVIVAEHGAPQHNG